MKKALYLSVIATTLAGNIDVAKCSANIPSPSSEQTKQDALSVARASFDCAIEELNRIAIILKENLEREDRQPLYYNGRRIRILSLYGHQIVEPPINIGQHEVGNFCSLVTELSTGVIDLEKNLEIEDMRQLYNGYQHMLTAFARNICKYDFRDLMTELQIMANHPEEYISVYTLLHNPDSDNNLDGNFTRWLTTTDGVMNWIDQQTPTFLISLAQNVTAIKQIYEMNPDIRRHVIRDLELNDQSFLLLFTWGEDVRRIFDLAAALKTGINVFSIEEISVGDMNVLATEIDSHADNITLLNFSQKIPDEVWGLFLDMLANNTSITDLFVNFRSKSDAQTMRFAEAVLGKRSGARRAVTTLRVYDIKNAGLTKIFEALEKDNRLERLIVNDQYNKTDVNDEVVRVLEQLLRINNTLAHLNLRNTSISEFGARTIFGALYNEESNPNGNRTLVEIFLPDSLEGHESRNTPFAAAISDGEKEGTEPPAIEKARKTEDDDDDDGTN